MWPVYIISTSIHYEIISRIGNGMKWTIVLAIPSPRSVLPEKPSTVMHDAALWLMHAISCMSLHTYKLSVSKATSRERLFLSIMNIHKTQFDFQPHSTKLEPNSHKPLQPMQPAARVSFLEVSACFFYIAILFWGLPCSRLYVPPLKMKSSVIETAQGLCSFISLEFCYLYI